MNRIAGYLILIFIFISCKHDRQSAEPIEAFTELENPVAADSSRWAKTPNGLQVAFGSVDKRYPKEDVPAVEGRTKWEGSAWRGERRHAQIVLWTADDVNNVQLELINLTT